MFGKNREGNEDLLKRLGMELGFDIDKVEPFYDDGVIISSTRIRNALKENNLDFANDMLGYDYFVRGRVVVGARRGSTLGFPTANVQLPDRNKLMPVNGIYFVSSEIEGQRHFGMANIGTRPTFTDDTEPTLEVFFFDFDRDIYGKDISVDFHKYIRPELKFPGARELIEQMKNDEIVCRELVKNF
jgi:riboflavin kinase/FMN adenylyltransferase